LQATGKVHALKKKNKKNPPQKKTTKKKLRIPGTIVSLINCLEEKTSASRICAGNFYYAAQRRSVISCCSRFLMKMDILLYQYLPAHSKFSMGMETPFCKV